MSSKPAVFLFHLFIVPAVFLRSVEATFECIAYLLFCSIDSSRKYDEYDHLNRCPDLSVLQTYKSYLTAILRGVMNLPIVAARPAPSAPASRMLVSLTMPAFSTHPLRRPPCRTPSSRTGSAPLLLLVAFSSRHRSCDTVRARRSRPVDAGVSRPQDRDPAERCFS